MQQKFPIKKWLRRVSEHIGNCVPLNCMLCGMGSDKLICQGCADQSSSSLTKRCISCGLPIFVHATHCGNCLKKRPAFDTTTTAFDYVPPYNHLVLALKFGHNLIAAAAMGELLAQAVLKAFDDDALPEIIIAVPLSQERLQERTFNQSVEVGKTLAERINRPIHLNIVKRIRNTEAQTLLHPNQRHQNIVKAFDLNDRYADKIRGRHVGVIDDVITTGATLHEIAKCLKQHGAARVSNLVVARTLPR